MATGTIILPLPGKFDDTNPPGIIYTNNAAKVLFDDTTQEYMQWAFRMPANYASAPLLKVQYAMASATTGNVEFECQIMAVSDGDSANIDTDSYDTANSNSASVPATAGHLDEISITLNNDDSLAANDYIRIKLSRDADDATNDTATGDAEVVAVTLEYTTT